MDEAIHARFLRYVDRSGESCWPWTGALDQDGYGLFQLATRTTRRAHRLSYEHYVEPLTAGLQIDHLCHDPKVCDGGRYCPHRKCVRPSHLRAGTAGDNVNRERSRTGLGRHKRGPDGKYVTIDQTEEEH